MPARRLPLDRLLLPVMCPAPFPVPQVGPEMEIPGYGCEDHFIEADTVEHSWVSSRGVAGQQ